MAKNSIVIIDYGSGNLRSAAKAFEKVIADEGMDYSVIVSDQAEDLHKATRIVLPGQGAFGDCMRGLEKSGLINVLEENVLTHKKPFLGICVGMQLLASRGLEGGIHAGLGWIEGEVVPMKPDDPDLKIPHMGWNELIMPSATPLQDNSHFILRHVAPDTHFYFVHSYIFNTSQLSHILAYSDYGGPVPAVVGKDNIIGVQFHPEKSHDAGLRLISDFVRWQP